MPASNVTMSNNAIYRYHKIAPVIIGLCMPKLLKQKVFFIVDARVGWQNGDPILAGTVYFTKGGQQNRICKAKSTLWSFPLMLRVGELHITTEKRKELLPAVVRCGTRLECL